LKRKFLTFVVHLTVEELIDILKENFPILSSNSKETGNCNLNDGPFSGRLVYGFRGIQEWFNVSHKKAQELKDTWLAPAVMQNGRKNVTDADYALKLFDNRKK